MSLPEAIKIATIANANNKNANNKKINNNDDNKKFSDTLSLPRKPSAKYKKTVSTLLKSTKKAIKIKLRQIKLTISRSKRKSLALTLSIKKQRKNISISVLISSTSASLILGSLTSRAKLLGGAKPTSTPAYTPKPRGLNEFIKRFSKLAV